MMGMFKRKKYKCLICEKGIGENSAVVRYRYEKDNMGEARICHKCANKFEKAEVEVDDGQSL